MYDENGRLKTPWEIRADEDAKQERDLQEAASKPAFKVPPSIFDKWAFVQLGSSDDSKAGPPKEESLLQLNTNINQHLSSDNQADANADLELGLDAEVDSGLEAEADEGANAEANLEELLNEDPMDPHLADTERIMRKYEQRDAERELFSQKMSLGSDPRGGIDKISACQVKHHTEADNKKIKEIYLDYQTGAKGPDGTPNGEKILEKWNAQLAFEEVIHQWCQVSELALEKFIKENFDKTWKKFDQYGRGSIDAMDDVDFTRELMNALAGDPLPEKNPYEPVVN